MSNARFFSAIALTAAVTGTLVAGLTLSRPAHADVPRTAECQWQFAGQAPAKLNESVTTYINGQLAAGRTSIVVVPLMSGASSVCAW